MTLWETPVANLVPTVATALAIVLACSMATADDIGYRLVRDQVANCEHCNEVDLREFYSLREKSLVEEASAFTLRRSEVLRIFAGKRPKQKAWCASALLTTTGKQRGREFATGGNDPLGELVVVYVGGDIVNVVLRGVLRVAPTLGCYESLEELRSALSGLAVIDVHGES